jgi:hypothetical protein
MKSKNALKWLALLAVLSALCLPAEAAAAAPGSENSGKAALLTAIDPDECEPFFVQTRIMEITRERGTLVVAERELREIDATVEGKRLKTELLGPDGKPEPAGAFRVGQYVKVEGFLHPDGYVAALVVQKIEKPVEPRLKYTPVEKSKKSLRRSAAAVRSK